MNTGEQLIERHWPSLRWGAVILLCAALLPACQQLEKPEPAAFYSETVPPRAQEFRWSNGKMPVSFDPMKASAPPDTDIVRAIFDGLTEIDPKTLEAVPALATAWDSDEDGKEWTFELRRDAKWSNGEPVTAEDFVRSWKRLARNKTEVAHVSHVTNIAGIGVADEADAASQVPEVPQRDQAETARTPQPQLEKPVKTKATEPPAKDAPAVQEKKAEDLFGAVATDQYTLKVSLLKPDAQFPRLVAHPVLRPIYGDGAYFDVNPLSAAIVTNGAFRIVKVEKDSVALERSPKYYAADSIRLEKARLVLAKDADSALADYRKGEVDAVTNTEFEPLALKLLTPFVDFRRTSHAALNFYEFNRTRPPFNDRRVREALAISIDRKRLAEDVTNGATVPAYGFLPFASGEKDPRIRESAARGRELLQRAGFENGRDFPVIRLVINRNELQQKIARAVAAMWKENLGVETEITVKELSEIDGVRASGDYDLIRRGTVLPTSDETANMLALFRPHFPEADEAEAAPKETVPTDKAAKGGPIRIPQMPAPLPEPGLGLTEFDGLPPAPRDELTVEMPGTFEPILTEDRALLEMPAIPLYFPTSYSLVKPYVYGFEMNPLDAPLLKSVRIDSNWKPKGRYAGP